MAASGSFGSALLNRLSWALRAGLQFQGKRDLYAVFGYKYRLSYPDFLIKYARQGVAKRIIDAPVNSTWLPQPILFSDPEFITAWKSLASGVPVWDRLTRADRLAALGRFSVLFIGYDDVTDVNSLKLPVHAGPDRKILYMQAYGEDVTAIAAYENDPANPRFGMPSMYALNMMDPSILTPTSVVPLNADSRAFKFRATRVHHSRILHVCSAGLEDDIFGLPALMPIYNDLDDLLKVAGGSAEAFWLNSNRGVQVDVDKEMELNPTDETALQQEIEDYQHELRRFIRTRGVNIKPLGSDPPHPKETFQMLISLIAASTGIPTRILLGSEAGQLASQQDRVSWAGLINERRLSMAEPKILFPFVNQLVAAGVLPVPSALGVQWADAFNLSPLEKAQTMAQTARSAINFARQFAQPGGIIKPITTIEEARRILGLSADPNKNTGIVSTADVDDANPTDTNTSSASQVSTEGEAATAPDGDTISSEIPNIDAA